MQPQALLWLQYPKRKMVNFNFYSNYVYVSEADDDEEDDITEALKQAIARGVKIEPWLEEIFKFKGEVTIDNLSPDKDAGLVFAKGATTTLPILVNSQKYIQFRQPPLFTIGELVDLKATGALGYVMGVEFIKGEFLEEDEWLYDVLPISKLYEYGLTKSEFEQQLNKISSSERPLIDVNFPQAKIGDLVTNKNNQSRIVTKITWNCQVDLTEINDLIKDEMTNFNPFYLYTLTGWDEEKNELNCFEISESFL